MRERERTERQREKEQTERERTETGRERVCETQKNTQTEDFNLKLLEKEYNF